MSLGLDNNAFPIPSMGFGGGSGSPFGVSGEYTTRSASENSRSRSKTAPAVESVRRLSSVRVGAQQSVRSLNQGVSAAHAAGSGLAEIAGGLGQLRNLASRASDAAAANSDGLLRDEQRSLFEAEFSAITGRIDRAAKATSFGGSALLGGDFADDHPIVSAAADGREFSLELESQTASELGLEGLDLAHSSATTAIDAASDRIEKARGQVDKFGGQVVSAIYDDLRESSGSGLSNTSRAIGVATRVSQKFSLQAQVGVLSQTPGLAAATLRLLE